MKEKERGKNQKNKKKYRNDNIITEPLIERKKVDFLIKKNEDKKKKVNSKEDNPHEFLETLIALLIVFIIIFLSYKAVLLFKNKEKSSNYFLSIGNDPYIGNGSTIIFAFLDFESPLSKEVFNNKLLWSLIKNNKITFVYKDYLLLEKHPLSFQTAIAARCAQEQSLFWNYSKLLYNNENHQINYLLKYADSINLNKTLFNDCFSSQRNAFLINKDLQEARNLEVVSVPTFFIKEKNSKYHNLKKIVGINKFNKYLSTLIKK